MNAAGIPDGLRSAGSPLLAKLLANISDTVTVVDDAGRVRFVSGASILGYSEQQWSSTSIFDLVHPDDRQRALEVAGAVLSTPGSDRVEDFRIRHADGSWAHVEVSAANLLDDPDVHGVVITSRNVTDRRRVADELALERDRAQAAAEARMRFVASVSHELRSPLHAIAGIGELLAVSMIDPAKRGLVEQIGEQVDQIVRLIDDLLDLARVESGNIELRPESCDLADLVGDVIRGARRVAAGSGAPGPGPEVRVEVADDLAAVVVDRLRIRQVLTNLIGNALKFTDSGEVVIRLARDGEWLDLSVADTGVGIPPEDVERIFDPFRQVGPDAAAKGFGLGLAITRQLVEAMGGTITAHSDLGAGSEFRVRLPYRPDRRRTERVANGEGADGPDVDTARDPAGRVPNVLVVDDSQVNRSLLLQQLGHLAVNGIEADGGAEALRLLDDSVDLVVMDRHMPELDGLEATRRIRSRGWTGPIVGLTASATESERSDCIAAGMDEVLAKPARLAEIAAVLERHAVGGPDGAPGARQPSEVDLLVADLGPDAAAMLIDVFLVELPTRVDALADSIGVDAGTVRREAHALRPTASLMGSPALADLCRAMEDDPEGHGLDGDHLRSVAGDLTATLRSRLDRIQRPAVADTAVDR
jgi:PAS domain S-box-containing protein